LFLNEPLDTTAYRASVHHNSISGHSSKEGKSRNLASSSDQRIGDEYVNFVFEPTQAWYGFGCRKFKHFQVRIQKTSFNSIKATENARM